MNPSIVLAAIDAGLRLGRKLHDVLIDETVERPLLLPLGNLIGDVVEADAIEYFREHPELTETGGPYHGFNREQKIQAYRTLFTINARLDASDQSLDEARQVVVELNRFEQLKKEFQSKAAVQRILGTVVEIGIDYLAANPGAIPGRSSSKQVIAAFVTHLDDIEFAEGTTEEITGDLLLAALRVFDANISIVDDDERLRSLLGGITGALVAEVKDITSQGKRLEREEFIRRIASSVLRGGASALAEDIALFIPDENVTRALVQSTLTSVLAGIQGKENLFTNESIELILRSSLNAIAENTSDLVDDAFLAAFLSSSVKALTDAQGRKLFGEQTVSAVVLAGIETLRDHAEMIIDPTNPGRQLLAEAVASIARSLATTLAGGGTVKDLLSPSQVVELSRIVFDEIARNPEHLLGVENDPDPKKTALAQIVGSLARALGDDPALLVTGEGFIELTRIAIQVAVRNADQLLDLDSSNTRTNLLFEIVNQVVEAVLADDVESRGLITRDVFLEIIERVLPIASANLDRLLDDAPNAVRDTLVKALDLASGVLTNRVNGANLPILIEQLLLQVLWRELNLAEETVVVNAAAAILRAA